MGDLPTARIEKPERAFTQVGIDFAGPFHVHDADSPKAFAAVFICLASKAVHLEAVSSLSTESMLLTLQRFIARRGQPIRIISDNAKNFIGTRNVLETINATTQSSSQVLSKRGIDIDWVFIPPRAPHFGGIWEAAVKQMKHHLRRVMGKQVLTFEEFSTLLCSIEYVLNSRPLLPLTESPKDLDMLTPFHLINGSHMGQLLIDNNCNQDSVDGRKRYGLLKDMLKGFWNKWSIEYVSSLQVRNKWKNEFPNVQVGDIVYVKEDNVPPLNWPLARIQRVYTGNDDKVRVVKLKTQRGELTRPIKKLKILTFE